MSKLSDDMLKYRAINRISQHELAKRVGVSLQTINTVENGTQEPSRITAEKIRQVIYKAEDR